MPCLTCWPSSLVTLDGWMTGWLDSRTDKFSPDPKLPFRWMNPCRIFTAWKAMKYDGIQRRRNMADVIDIAESWPRAPMGVSQFHKYGNVAGTVNWNKNWVVSSLFMTSLIGIAWIVFWFDESSKELVFNMLAVLTPGWGDASERVDGFCFWKRVAARKRNCCSACSINLA